MSTIDAAIINHITKSGGSSEDERLDFSTLTSITYPVSGEWTFNENGLITLTLGAEAWPYIPVIGDVLILKRKNTDEVLRMICSMAELRDDDGMNFRFTYVAKDNEIRVDLSLASRTYTINTTAFSAPDNEETGFFQLANTEDGGLGSYLRSIFQGLTNGLRALKRDII